MKFSFRFHHFSKPTKPFGGKKKTNFFFKQNHLKLKVHIVSHLRLELCDENQGTLSGPVAPRGRCVFWTSHRIFLSLGFLSCNTETSNTPLVGW